jgi:hypothetical protein
VAVDEFEQAIKNALIMSEYTIKEFSMFVSALAEMQSYPGRLYKTSYGKENQVYFSEDEQGIKEFESLSGLVYSQWANIFNKNLEMQSKNGGS